MKQEINIHQFRDSFTNMDRDYYSWEGYKALFDYYDEVEGFELDVIAICCDVSEYDEEELLTDFGYLIDIESYNEEDKEFNIHLDDLKDELEQQTHLIKLENNRFLVWGF